MKIGIITDPMDTRSSVRVYLSNLIENMLKLYDPDKIYLIHSRRSDDPMYRRAHELILHGFYRHDFPSASLADLARPFRLRKLKLDVIHYTHSHAPLTFLSAGTKNVCLITTIGPVTHPQYYPLPSRYIIRLSRLLNRRMDAIITESESEKKAIVEFLGIDQGRVRVIPSGVDDIYKPCDDLDGVKSDLATRYGVEPPFVLHVGAYRPVKNGPALVKAFAEVKRRGLPHRLVLVGNPEQSFGEVLRLIEQLGLSAHVIRPGYVPREDLPGFYGAADAFVLPSFKESFGHVLVEAMACGCPVVTSNVTCMPEVVGDAGILIDPYDVDSLAEGMYRVLTSDELRQDLKQRSLDRATHYSWEKCARETLEVYRDVWGEGRKPSW